MLQTLFLKPSRILGRCFFSTLNLQNKNCDKLPTDSELSLFSYNTSDNTHDSFPQTIETDDDLTILSRNKKDIEKLTHNLEKYKIEGDRAVLRYKYGTSEDLSLFYNNNPYTSEQVIIKDQKSEILELLKIYQTPDVTNFVVGPEYILNDPIIDGSTNKEAFETVPEKDDFTSSLIKYNSIYEKEYFEFIENIDKNKNINFLSGRIISPSKLSFLKNIYNFWGVGGITKCCTFVVQDGESKFVYKKIGRFSGDRSFFNPLELGNSVGHIKLHNDSTGRSYDCLILQCADANKLGRDSFMSALTNFGKQEYDIVIFSSGSFPFSSFNFPQISKLFKNKGVFIYSDTMLGVAVYNINKISSRKAEWNWVPSLKKSTGKYLTSYQYKLFLEQGVYSIKDCSIQIGGDETSLLFDLTEPFYYDR